MLEKETLNKTPFIIGHNIKVQLNNTIKIYNFIPFLKLKTRKSMK